MFRCLVNLLAINVSSFRTINVPENLTIQNSLRQLRKMAQLTSLDVVDLKGQNVLQKRSHNLIIYYLSTLLQINRSTGMQLQVCSSKEVYTL